MRQRVGLSHKVDVLTEPAMSFFSFGVDLWTFVSKSLNVF